MRFLADAQLPLRLASWLIQAGHDALHTLNLLPGIHTLDADVIATTVRDARIVK